MVEIISLEINNCRSKNAASVSEVIALLLLAKQPKRYKLWSCQKMCGALYFLLDNIFIRFGSKIYIDKL